jgi:hypothetical protein
MAAMEPAVCRRVKLKVAHDERQYGGTNVKAYVDGVLVGVAGTRTYSAEGRYHIPDIAPVGLLNVNEGFRRCRIATQMYEALQRKSCELGLRLASDKYRTDATERFWRKQVEKGRAQCVVGEGGVRLGPNFKHVGEWRCHHYEMNEACPSVFDLGRRR